MVRTASMKSINTIAVVLLFMLCGVASSQSTYVRVDSLTNLRADHSLDASILDTVPAGTILRVINWQDHWLRVVHGHERAWMADWVNYVMLRSGSDADATMPFSQTENCCVLEWQCPDHRARTSGHWAYRYRRCHRTESYLTEDFSIHNCCFLSQGCARDQQWREGYVSFSTFECELRGVKIDASAEFKGRIYQAIAMLKDRAPVWYAYTISGLDQIREIADPARAGLYAKLRRYDEVASKLVVEAPGDAPIIWVAGVLVHEACHVHLNEAALFTEWGSQPEEEKACTEVQLIVNDIIDPTNYYHDYLQTLIDNIHDPAYQWW